VKRGAALGIAALVAASSAGAQQVVRPPADHTATYRADSLRLAGRPWHAAETLLAAARRDPNPNAFLIVEGAKAEVLAKRYERARTVLAGQPWLADYVDGEALAVLAQAEFGLGRFAEAASHFEMARSRAPGIRANILAVRAGVAFDAAGQPDSAARAFRAARTGGKLAAIDAWLRVRQARVTADSAVARELLTDVPAPAARGVPLARARSLLLAGDTTRALDAFTAAGKGLETARLALAVGDTARARAALYGLLSSAPLSDDGAAGVALALGPLPPHDPAEHVALGRALNRRATIRDAQVHVEHALRRGDSSATTRLLYGELLVAGNHLREAARVYAAASRDSALGPLATYRRARVLVRLADPGAQQALTDFGRRYPTDTAAPGALWILADLLDGRDDWNGAARWYRELITAIPPIRAGSLARLPPGGACRESGASRQRRALLSARRSTPHGPQRAAARFWLGKIAEARGDSTQRARSGSRSPARTRSATTACARAGGGARAARVPSAADAGARPAGRHRGTRAHRHASARRPRHRSAGRSACRAGAPPAGSRDAPLLERRTGRAGLRIGRRSGSAGKRRRRRRGRRASSARSSLAQPRRRRSRGGRVRRRCAPARGARASGKHVRCRCALASGRAWACAAAAEHRGDVSRAGWMSRFIPSGSRCPISTCISAPRISRSCSSDSVEWTRRSPHTMRVPTPVRRWLTREGADDPDRFVELIPYPETRGYVRSLLRNRELYRALYGPSENPLDSYPGPGHF
jgi:tetratricopeptide (TPR) repeat protein